MKWIRYFTVDEVRTVKSITLPLNLSMSDRAGWGGMIEVNPRTVVVPILLTKSQSCYWWAPSRYWWWFVSGLNVHTSYMNRSAHVSTPALYTLHSTAKRSHQHCRNTLLSVSLPLCPPICQCRVSQCSRPTFFSEFTFQMIKYSNIYCHKHINHAQTKVSTNIHKIHLKVT